MRVVIRLNSASWAGARWFFSRLSTKPRPPEVEPFVAQLSISEVRREIRRAADAPGGGEASTALLGRVFHEVFAALTSGDATVGWQHAWDGDNAGDRKALIAYVYEKLLGPRLTRHQAALRDNGPQVLQMWIAARLMCDWLTDMLASALNQGTITYDHQTEKCSGAEALCLPEQPLSLELKEPGWTAPVLVSGTADALWRNPRTGNWCVVEYKLGRTSPEADLAQACLYHMLLAASGQPRESGALCVIAFHPERKETFFESAEIAAAQQKLVALIGRLAGVLPSEPATPPVNGPVPDLASTVAHRAIAQKLSRALEQFGIKVQIAPDPIAGPSFLRYTAMPGRGVRVSDIRKKAEDLQVQLGLERAPFIQNAGGRLVIDVQRPDRRVVLFSSIENQLPPRVPGRSCTKALIGLDLDRKLQFADLKETTHLLVAGTSGSGKSELLRSMVAGLISSNSPETLRLVLIDPKRTAFGDLKGSAYLFGENGLVYPPEHSASDVLDTLIDEMEQRYRLLEGAGVDHLAEYVEKIGDVKPRIVCVCDEYADLIADRVSKREVEQRIFRLGAKARAAGIHLIIATQYPTREVVGGALKANLAGRVCLRLVNHTQSNVVIGMSGAENLLGRGDLLYVDTGDPVRLQAPYLSAEERARVFRGEVAEWSRA